MELTAFGRVAGAPWQQAVTADTVALRGISTLWARRKIENALDSRVDGVSADLIRKIVLDVALEHKIVSPYTSFVAVDQEPARSSSQALGRQGVANMAPAGQAAVAVPQTFGHISGGDVVRQSFVEDELAFGYLETVVRF